MSKTLFDLIKIIKKRKSKNSNKSYTYFLFRNGKAYCLKKFKEEALELIKALQSNKKKNIIHESADVIYHFLILLELKNINIKSVFKELDRRRKMSGIEEKRSRPKKK
jgi:phosphoribosyl-ATP pyrophosphohydrolase